MAEHLATHALADRVADAQVVVTELLTNALLHAEPPFEVLLHLAPAKARIEVRDGSAQAPMYLRAGAESMTGRGLRLVEGLTDAWGATPLPAGKSVWVELTTGDSSDPCAGEERFVAPWLPSGPVERAADLHLVRLGDVPTDLLLTAKAHVDDLVREFTLATAGASSGLTSRVPEDLAQLIEVVVHRFAEARESIRQQALAARAQGRDHVHLELRLSPSAAAAGEEYLAALDRADAYCRAARLLTLETPPQHRLFRHWYVGELVTQLRQAAAGRPTAPAETFEQRLLREVGSMAEREQRVARATRLHDLAIELASATTPEAVAQAALYTGASALGAAGSAMLLLSEAPTLEVPGTIGYDPELVARLEHESPSTELPAATALRTGEAVFLESTADRDERFPELAGMEPGTRALVAVPLEVADRRLGALRFSFPEKRLFDTDERTFIRAIATQTAQALERTQLWAARREATRRLQSSLLPPAFPEVPGVTISAAYNPLTQSLEIGGDFYDVWQRRADQLIVAIGDVCGHGPEAAATTTLIRHTLRALTMSSADPVAILKMLDIALKDSLEGTDHYATVAFGFLTIGTGACELDFATGGHHGPLVLRADGAAEVVECDGSLLGILPDVEIHSGRVRLDAGDRVVFVTDGVTDARDGSGAWFGFDGIRRAIAAAGDGGPDVAEAISQAVIAHCDGCLHDDFAVLSLCVAPA